MLAEQVEVGDSLAWAVKVARRRFRRAWRSARGGWSGQPVGVGPAMWARSFWRHPGGCPPFQALPLTYQNCDGSLGLNPTPPLLHPTPAHPTRDGHLIGVTFSTLAIHINSSAHHSTPPSDFHLNPTLIPYRGGPRCGLPPDCRLPTGSRILNIEV